MSEIESKLRIEIREGFTQDLRSLKRAIELTLEANGRELANQQFTELAKRLLGHSEGNSLLSEDVVSILRSCMNLASENTGSRSSDFEASINGEPLETRSWRDIHTGIAEAFLKLGRHQELEQITRIYSTTSERLKRSGKPYPESAYRKLSNGRFLFTHMSAEAHKRICNSLLASLPISRNSITIRYQADYINLPE